MTSQISPTHYQPDNHAKPFVTDMCKNRSTDDPVTDLLVAIDMAKSKSIIVAFTDAGSEKLDARTGRTCTLFGGFSEHTGAVC